MDSIKMKWPIYRARFDIYCHHCDVHFSAPGVQDIYGTREWSNIYCPKCDMNTFSEVLCAMKLEILSDELDGHYYQCQGDKGTCYHSDHWHQLTEHAKQLYLSVNNDPRDGGIIQEGWEFWNYISAKHSDVTHFDDCGISLKGSK